MKRLVEASLGAAALSLVACGTSQPEIKQTSYPTSLAPKTELSPECARQGILNTTIPYETRLNLALGRTYLDPEGGMYTLTVDIRGIASTVADLERSQRHPLSARVENGSILHIELHPDGQDTVDNFRQGLRGVLNSCNVLRVNWKNETKKITDIFWNNQRQQK